MKCTPFPLQPHKRSVVQRDSGFQLLLYATLRWLPECCTCKSASCVYLPAMQRGQYTSISDSWWPSLLVIVISED